MTAECCGREDELLDALGRGFVGAELASHVEQCAACAETHHVAAALLDDRATAMAAAPIPSAGTMWWRMQARRRHDAEIAARRSLLIGQAATLAVAIVLTFALLGADAAVGIRDAVTSFHVSSRMIVALAVPLLLAPLAGWIAVRAK